MFCSKLYSQHVFILFHIFATNAIFLLGIIIKICAFQEPDSRLETDLQLSCSRPHVPRFNLVESELDAPLCPQDVGSPATSDTWLKWGSGQTWLCLQWHHQNQQFWIQRQAAEILPLDINMVPPDRCQEQCLNLVASYFNEQVLKFLRLFL